MHLQLEGIYASLVTPFDSNGELDENGLMSNVDFVLKMECMAY